MRISALRNSKNPFTTAVCELLNVRSFSLIKNKFRMHAGKP